MNSHSFGNNSSSQLTELLLCFGLVETTNHKHIVDHPVIVTILQVIDRVTCNMRIRMKATKQVDLKQDMENDEYG